MSLSACFGEPGQLAGSSTHQSNLESNGVAIIAMLGRDRLARTMYDKRSSWKASRPNIPWFF